MIIRAKAPLRLSFAGGGTDVSPYSDIYGGAVLNATISLYAYATIEPIGKNIIFNSIDTNKSFETKKIYPLKIEKELELFKGIYNRIIKQFNDKKPLSFRLTTYSDAPPGSGLGTSSTIVVAVIGAFVEWLRLPLGEYDIAHLAYEIERIELGYAGGKQDQYAATFGGFNFMEFYGDGRVIVNPLRIKKEYINELQWNILLYYTGTSRFSSTIIEKQVKNVKEKREISLEAMHKLKEQAFLMKEAVLKGKLNEIGELLDYGWQLKKRTADEVSNDYIEEVYQKAKRAGALGGKISGAGGGGFIMLYCPNTTRYKVIEELKKYGGEFRRFEFTNYGLETWKV